MSDNNSASGISEFVRHQKKDERIRLHFSTVKKQVPEIGTRVEFIRSRVVELKNNFESDAHLVLKYSNYVTIATVSVAIVLIIVAIFSWVLAKDFTSSATTYFSIALIVATVGAGTQALGLHKKHAAFSAARWRMAALRIRIDQEVLELAIRCEQRGVLSEDERGELEKKTQFWIESIEHILGAFGGEYGRAIQPLKPPRPGSNQQESS